MTQDDHEKLRAMGRDPQELLTKAEAAQGAREVC